MRIPRPKLSYANVIATIALFVALGGAAVAAGLPKNSVGANQLKRNAVTTAKLKRAAVTAGKLAPKAVVAGKLGANAVLPGNLGNGIITLLGTLKSGQTLRGVFAIGGEDKITPDSVSFQFPLLNPPAAPKENVLDIGGTNANCAGISGTATPQANPGQLCVYIASKSTDFEGLEFIEGATNRLGFGLSAGFKTADPANLVYGQWAVTAP